MWRSPSVVVGLAMTAALSSAPPVAVAQEAVSVVSDSTRPFGTPVPARVVTRIVDELRVEVQADVTIRYGSIITVQWEIGGRTLDAGRAEVTSVDGRILMARITEGEPNEGMQAFVWVASAEDHFEAGEVIFEGEWPDDPVALRNLRQTAVTHYLQANARGWSPHEGAIDRLDKIRKDWRSFDMLPRVQTGLGDYYYRLSRECDRFSTPPLCGESGRAEDSAEWYRLAAAQNHAPAIRKLASAYSSGRGVEKNVERAHELLDEAVSLGDLQAMNDLAWHYGFRGHSSQAEGIGWLTRAAEAGHCRSVVELVSGHLKGVWFYRTVEKDVAGGLDWFARGIQAGCLPLLGIRMRDVAPDDASTHRLAAVRGVLVMDVAEGLASDGRLEVDDVVIALDDEPIQDTVVLALLLVRRRPGDEVELLVVRGGRERRITLQFRGS